MLTPDEVCVLSDQAGGPGRFARLVGVSEATVRRWRRGGVGDTVSGAVRDRLEWARGELGKVDRLAK